MSKQHKPAIFFSYTRIDDKNARGALSNLRQELEQTLHVVSGQPIEIFQDIEGIRLGQDIRQRIEESLDEAMVFVPILTPSYFHSAWCRAELERFLQREQQLGINNLIIPIYYRTYRTLEHARSELHGASTVTDTLVREMAPRLYADWRGLRRKNLEDQEVRDALEHIAEHILEVLDELKQAQAAPRPQEPEQAPLRVRAQGQADPPAGEPEQADPPAGEPEQADPPAGEPEQADPQARLNPALVEFMPDPGDQGALELIEDEAGAQWLLNPRNGYRYPVVEGIPKMLLDEGAKHRDESLIRSPEPEPAPSAPRPSVVALLGTVRDPQQPTPARVQAGFTLGEQGDPRFPVTLSEWWDELPRLRPGQSAGYFCRVPTGTYVIGDAGQDARDDEQPPYRVHQEHGFYIARYPITNAQWQAWVRVGGPPAGGADADGLNHPNQPVVGVGWDACRDFCNWLTQALMHVRNEREGRARASHVIVRLPSEAEWESAARGSKGLRYTWGNEWRPDRAASKDDQSTRGTAATVPVGCYPLGAAPCGALDMLGNIWEWTASPWTPSHAAQQAAKITDDAAQLTLKGGSYKTRPALIRCGARSSGSRDSRHPDLGFRVVVELR